eukprot:scaffold1397_cov254-Pinguiococcus_pyrenoidosus.AAC.37
MYSLASFSRLSDVCVSRGLSGKATAPRPLDVPRPGVPNSGTSGPPWTPVAGFGQKIDPGTLLAVTIATEGGDEASTRAASRSRSVSSSSSHTKASRSSNTTPFDIRWRLLWAPLCSSGAKSCDGSPSSASRSSASSSSWPSSALSRARMLRRAASMLTVPSPASPARSASLVTCDNALAASVAAASSGTPLGAASEPLLPSVALAVRGFGASLLLLPSSGSSSESLLEVEVLLLEPAVSELLLSLLSCSPVSPSANATPAFAIAALGAVLAVELRSTLAS